MLGNVQLTYVFSGGVWSRPGANNNALLHDFSENPVFYYDVHSRSDKASA